MGYEGHVRRVGGEAKLKQLLQTALREALAG
jgi:hypothetical protein